MRKDVVRHLESWLRRIPVHAGHIHQEVIPRALHQQRRRNHIFARHGNGHTLLFAINPIWRGETIGSYGLVFNAILNFDRLTPGD